MPDMEHARALNAANAAISRLEPPQMAAGSLKLASQAGGRVATSCAAALGAQLAGD